MKDWERMGRKNDKLQAGKPALKDVNQLGQPIVLIEIRSDIPVEFVDDGMLVGNWSQAHWDDAAALCTPMAHLAESTLNISGDQIMTSLYIDSRSRQNSVSIGAGVFMRAGLQPVSLESLCEPVAAFVQSAVGTSAAERAQTKLFSKQVTDEGLRKSQAVAEEFLKNLGGTSIKTPMTIGVAGQAIVVKGRYVRHDFKDLPEPVLSRVVGKVDGLRRSKRELWIWISSKECKSVQFDAERFLFELVDLLLSGEKVEFSIERRWFNPKKYLDRLLAVAIFDEAVSDLLS
jgi:hypothetical protein